MDDARKANFLNAVRAARVELLEIIGRFDEQTLATAKVPGTDWTAKDVLAHLIGYDLAILQAAKDVHEGHPFVWPWSSSSFDAVNEDNVGVRRERSSASILAELDGTRASLIRELEGWSEGAGPFGVDSWDLRNSAISWLAPHEREHAEMIAKLGDFPGSIPGVD